LMAPTIQEDGREQRGARRPDTSGDVPGADDGGGNGQPKGGGMTKWMDDEQNLSTRRAGGGRRKCQGGVVRESIQRVTQSRRPDDPA